MLRGELVTKHKLHKKFTQHKNNVLKVGSAPAGSIGKWDRNWSDYV